VGKRAAPEVLHVDITLDTSGQRPDDGIDETALVSSGSDDDDTPTTTNAGTFVNGGYVTGATTPARADTDAGVSLKHARRDELMSFSQIRLWFPSTYLDQLTPFNCTTSYRIQGPINTARLESAFAMLIDRHDSFRTLFYNDAATGEPMQQVINSSPFTLKLRLGGATDDVDREFRNIASYEYDLSMADTFIATLVSHNSVEHTIIFGYHHIVMDGVSWQITLNDLAYFYEHLAAEDMPSIRQYADFTVKQRQLVQHRDAVLADKIMFWRKELADSPSLLDLFPFAKVSTRKTLTRYNTLDHISHIEPSLVAKIKKASLSAKCTSFHFYLSTFVVMLHRFLDAGEMVLGIIDANRSDKQFLNTVGFLLDMLPLRLKVNKKERFVHTLRNTRTRAYSALANSGVPLETILEELRIPTSTTNTPLFQVLFNYRMGALRAPKMGDAVMSFLQYEDAKAPFDLTVSVDEKDDGSGMLTFSMQDYLYDIEGADLLVSTYINLLDSLSTDSSQRLHEVSLANKLLSDKALVAGTGEIAEFGWEKSLTLSQRVEWQAAQSPDALAVKDLSGTSRTRGEIQARASIIASALKENGVTYGSRVAVYCEATVDSIACILATHKVGGVYVPLDVRNSPERLVAVVTECNPTIILCHEATAVSVTSFAGEQARILNISDLKDASSNGDNADGQDSSAIQDLSRLSDPAFILYTSGSTGKPKGIMLSQSACSIHFASISSSLGLTESDVVLQQSALGFDASLAQMFFAAVNGAALVLGNNRGDPADMASIMEAEKVTVTLFIISEMSALLQHGGEALSRCHSWRIALCGGEAFTSSLLQKFRRLDLPNLDLYNAYGPTEATIITSLGKVPYRNGFGDDDHKVPVGPPIPNYGVYVLDDQLKPAPLGWPGELCICGPCVSLGYVGQPALTEAKFRPDNILRPSTASFKGWDRLYRTGDRARQLSDGSFVFLGRVDGDSQVKLRGIRIELGEISSAIIKSSAGTVTDAATIAKGETLVSFVVMASGAASQVSPQQSTASFLRDLVQSLPLPLYMRPALAVPLDRLPFTERGKLDMKALAAIHIGQRHDNDPREADEHMQLTTTEQKLKQVWLDILSHQQFSIPIDKKSDFFSVGGNSLLLIRLRAGIESAFGIVVPLAQLFQMSSLETLAARLDSSVEPVLLDVIDWEQESLLDANLLTLSDAHTLRSVDIADVHEGLCVVLTGSTGFLGRELLRQLIANSRIAAIHCLAIRPGRSLPKELSSNAKVTPHVGDLADEWLGLDEQEARVIFSTAHVVIHNGAQVSHMKSYPSLRKTNVDSTRQLLDLAIRSSLHRKDGAEVPSFHFVSTAGVAGLAIPAAASSFRQISVGEFPPATDGSNGYVAAKWASERILELAAVRLGLTVSIHRPSNITGPGVGDQDIVHSVWRWAETLRAVPDLAAAGAQGAFDFVGVDTCATNIICAVFEPSEVGKVRYLHQSGDVIVPVGSFQQELEKRMGVEVSVLPFAEWVDKAVEAGLDELVATFLRQTNGAFKMPFLIKSDC
jgi:pseurotin A synthetase (hybrid polyketide synthase/nonribosomal peptide synthetase)